ncbi:molybdenum cofactor biosynthesis protein MoaE [Agromyces sp. H3Y2-19a]|uniref:molybdenum cofactor biosynthesis protein MoaE n=1 Tax=Agromyces TaxID=33877 RepID=UPI001E3055FE|nr:MULTISPECIES: molybdenum cofactor biosynthesis protein MoaE [Agromyces]MCD5347991.1 molybdenum cofactor biosynthesis protein MoaE [Agromyces sp. S2-1-8]MDF0514415.1 molybdenum cofactor biosynthesis protein MoaE [Agromyces chromiiresistens]
MSTTLAAITAEPIDEQAVRAAVEADESGAIVLFCGVVRDHDGGRGVRSLDYRAHPEAERFLAECVERVADETGLAIAAVHRVGELKIGDVALYAATAAAHRAEAFDACERLVEEIKRTVPIWKRQHFADGVSEWVGL